MEEERSRSHAPVIIRAVLGQHGHSSQWTVALNLTTLWKSLLFEKLTLLYCLHLAVLYNKVFNRSKVSLLAQKYFISCKSDCNNK